MRLLALLLLLSSLSFAADLGLTLTNRAYRYKAKNGELIGFYPALDAPGNPKAATMFNERMHRFLNERRQTIAAADRKNYLTLRLSFTQAITSGGIISVRFEILAEDRLNAHPGNLYITLVIDTLHLRELELKDLFLPGTAWLDRLVQYSRAELSGRDLASTEEWIEKGTAPNPGNFAVFRLSDRELEITFPPYQVAPYSSGTQRVAIPTAVLEGFLRPDLF